MYKKFYAGSEWLDWPLVGLILFVTIFAIALWRVARMRPRQVSDLAALPLEDTEILLDDRTSTDHPSRAPRREAQTR